MRDLVIEAAKIAGSQTALAGRIGKSKQLVQKLCCGERRVSAEVAVAIDDATAGRVAKHQLRPDVFSAPLKDAAEAGAAESPSSEAAA